ncbi:hypothetical protein RPB_2950 [Rhodopseudomonas palustris HaA2]|uniref:Uncharacterized protein n=1 Tax=Rhodopseudomonas palustris (strain HaA2) TaxID=316058 RepID=Q2IVV8_RHOP2|nr:hypothetical protein [Rhodopseudomonas palustris]ABD07652.1 hypothetical protein RPB_2950 [Rhodopseudomonas palustris HaA2]
MARIGNARTIADIEFVIDAPSPATDQATWTVHGVECSRERHRYNGPSYSFALEILQLRSKAQGQPPWHVVIIGELWNFYDAKAAPHKTQHLKVISGKAADILAWMRHNRNAKLQRATSHDGRPE